MTDERDEIAEELRLLREAVSAGEPTARSVGEVLPAPLPTRTPEGVTRAPDPAREAPAPPRPGLDHVNAAWDVRATGRLRGFIGRLLRRALLPLVDAQTEFNGRQAQFDNRLLDWIEARFAHTHRHYDAVLGLHGRHMQEIDQRHLQLQEDLVAHVHDLVKRIDLVLSDTERGRLSLEVALRDVRARLREIEQRLPRPSRDPREPRE